MKAVLILLIHGYRYVVSPLLHALCGPGGGCRFEPSCSLYSLEAVRTHGSLRGSWLAAKRICRCHPWGGCGFDPVPPISQFSPSPREQKLSCHSMNQSTFTAGGPIN